MFFFVFLVFALLIGGVPPADPDTENSLQRDAIYLRATNEFSSAILFKPAPEFENEPAFRLAPLIFKEVHGDPPVDDPKTGNRLAVYFYQDTLRIKDRDHLRYSYLWASTNAKPGNTASGMAQLLGIRVTADSDGKPVLWEMLDRVGGTEVVFAAQSLETLAVAQHGAVLPGKRYALERSLTDSPRAILARIIEDGPVPMGPMVYVSMDPLHISAVACRCMPTQAKHLTMTLTYDLKPLQNAGPEISQLRSEADANFAFWPGDAATDDRVLNLLRLPTSF